MSAQPQVTSRAVRTLQAVMMTQIILGVTRYFGPLLGWDLPQSAWLIHPVLGASIVVAVIIMLRPRPGATATPLRRVARFAPLAPLALGLAIAFGLRLSPGLAPLHMVVGITALAIVDRALKHVIVEPARGQPHVFSPRPQA